MTQVEGAGGARLAGGRRSRVNEDSRPHERPLHDGAAEQIAFGLPGLPGARNFAAAYAHRQGMPDDRVGELLLAVNEVATNAVTHGNGRATMRVWCAGDHLVVEVHDEGHWPLDGATPGATPPGPYATSGMGLWVARRLSSGIDFATGASGTTVTMSFKV
ncbi:ATP-binding protein [Spongiactinospora gelatinilytica]|uniref:ATP-binding protein n=1 Tax=Spongiactinospora gelatinilytica TaxID=2666298 RepID=A0A2W2GME7_9ACTN|nr:ATP-binding protein [Spongiactinospora gelatinilytica]